MEIRLFRCSLVLSALLTACGGGSSSTGAAQDTTPPVISVVTVSGMNTQGKVRLEVSASDDTRPTGYCFKTDSTPPSASDACFNGGDPRSDFITIQKDSQTYFVWAKDAANHVSASMRAVVEGDTLAPSLSSVDTFVSPTNGSVELTVTATDNKGVAGYCFKTDETKPAASDPCFTADPKLKTDLRSPSQLYHVWAKDFAGNISNDTTRYAGCDLSGHYASQQSKLPTVCFSTSLGDFVVELENQKAPATVANFLGYVNKGFYSGTIFHRIISTFMVQGGGFSSYPNGYKNPDPAIPLESTQKTGLSHLKGTLAMARSSDPDTATSQFFINVVNNVAGTTNTNLDYQSDAAPGYAVFGRVIYGMDASIEKIRQVAVTNNGSNEASLPTSPPIIHWAYRLK